MKINNLRKIIVAKKAVYLAASVASALVFVLILSNLLSSKSEDYSGYAKHFDHNHKIMKPYYQAIANNVFKSFSEAKSLMIGNTYINRDKGNFVVYVKPVNFKVSMSELTDEATKNKVSNKDYENMYKMYGSIKENSLVFEKLEPFVYKNMGFKSISEEDWSLSNFHLKLLSYLMPGMLDMFEATNSTFRGMDKFIVSYLPHAIMYKENLEQSNTQNIYQTKDLKCL